MTASTTSIKTQTERIHQQLNCFRDLPERIMRSLFINLEIDNEKMRSEIYDTLKQLEAISSGGSIAGFTLEERLDFLFSFDLITRQMEDHLNENSQRDEFLNYSELIRELLYDYKSQAERIIDRGSN